MSTGVVRDSSSLVYRGMRGPMAQRLLIAALWGIGGYSVFAVGGAYLVVQLSSNAHDRSVEAAMTGAFVFGPVGALLGALVGFWRASRRL